MAEELATFMTHFEVEAMLRKEKVSAASVDQKPPYVAEVAAELYPSEYKVPLFQIMTR